MPANSGLSCPVCYAPLTDNESGVACLNKHHFDRSKQGHINLLLNQHKKSKLPGDSAEMVLARKQFFDQGYYAPIRDQIVQLCVTHGAGETAKKINWIDVGCGEGYYSNAIDLALKQHTHRASGAAFDISTPAIKTAAKHYPSSDFFVGNAATLPISEASQSLVTSLFCRVLEEEAARVLRHNGILIVANTGEHHLIELRENIYEEIRAFKPTRILKEYFSHEKRVEINSSFTCKSPIDQLNLLKMTPHYWRCSDEAKLKLEDQLIPKNTLDVVIDVYRKN